MATNNKETIYVDIDDEITAVIEKVRASNEKIIALVLPKRASVLQSIVNMKLLKRSADQAKKHVVLITSEAGLLPLAGSVGFYVAKNLQTKPEIPTAQGEVADIVEDATEGEDVDFSPDAAATTPVGQLAAAAGTPLAAESATDAIETLEIDDEPDTPVADAPVASEPIDAKAKPVKKNHKLAVPNFNRFRVLLVLLVLGIILLGGLIYVANVILPKGTIIIKTDTNDVNSSLTLNLDTATKTLDAKKLAVPAQLISDQKNGSQQVATTGKLNNGTKATGQVTLSLPDCSTDQVTIPAGTGVSSNGLTFITQAAATLSSVKVGNQCKNSSFPTFSTATVTVNSQNAGAQYNVAASSFKVSGYSGVAASSSDPMTGGTDNIVQVVAQADIDSATQKITAQSADAVKQELLTKIKQQGLFAIQTTYQTGTPNVTQSAKVGDQVGTLTVTQSTTYTMFGVKQDDLKTLVDNDVKGKIDPAKQSILTEGLDKANFRIIAVTDKTAQLVMSTTSVAGPDLKSDTIKQLVAGKKSGEIQTLLKADPGVSDVTVKFSPFWVTKAPSKPAKLTVTFVKATP